MLLGLRQQRAVKRGKWKNEIVEMHIELVKYLCGILNNKMYMYYIFLVGMLITWAPFEFSSK